MFHHSVLIHKIAKRLKSLLPNAHLAACYTQNKDELILIFDREGKTFAIKADLRPQVSLLSFPDQISRARKNSVDLFSQLISKKVLEVTPHPLNRSFSIVFEGQLELVIKMYGRRSNVLLYEGARQADIFRSELKQDAGLELDSFYQNEKLLEGEIDTEISRILTKPVTDYLKCNQIPNSARVSLEHLLSLPTYILTSPQPSIEIIPQKSNSQNSFSDVLEAVNEYQKRFVHETLFDLEKGKQLQKLRKQKTQTENYIKKTSKKINDLKGRRSYRELADILMANLHQIEKGKDTVTLFDFYQNKNIEVKMKKNQTPQQQAEQLYKKAKNEKVEIEKHLKNLLAKQNLLTQLDIQIEHVEDIQDWKSLRKIEKEASTGKKSDIQLPYISFTKEGFEIRIGKDAKRNDQLTTKYAAKEDLWLHAKDVAGSHVVIKNPTKGKIPFSVIEYAAGLAGYYSKRKSDTICPVLYTPRKYVRKSKKLAPGKVIVEKEEVVLVEPLNPNK